MDDGVDSPDEIETQSAYVVSCEDTPTADGGVGCLCNDPEAEQE